MRVFLAYALAYAVGYAALGLVQRLTGPSFDRAREEILHADSPIGFDPRVSRMLMADELVTGLLCGPIFVLVGLSNPLLHVTIFAASILVLQLIFLISWWLICHFAPEDRLSTGVTVLDEALGFTWGFARFVLALFGSAMVALWLAT